MKKRLLAVFLTCVMLFSLLPATALAAGGTVNVRLFHAAYEWNPVTQSWQAVSSADPSYTALSKALSALDCAPEADTTAHSESTNYTMVIPSGSDVTPDTDGLPTITYTYNGISYTWHCIGFREEYALNGGSLSKDVQEWTVSDGAAQNATVTLESEDVRQANLRYCWVLDGRGKTANPERAAVVFDFVTLLEEDGVEIPEGSTIEIYGTNNSSVGSGVTMRLNIDNDTYQKIEGVENGKKTVQWPMGYTLTPAIAIGYPSLCIKITNGTVETYCPFSLWANSSGEYQPAFILSSENLTLYAKYNTNGYVYTIDRATMYDVTTSYNNGLAANSSDSSDDFSDVKAKINAPDAETLSGARNAAKYPEGRPYTVKGPTTTDMTVEEIADSSVVPYLCKYDENGGLIAKWKCIGFTYPEYYLTNNNQYSKTSEIKPLGTTITLPTGEYYTYETLRIRYIWELDGNTVTYDLNVAAAGSDAAAGQLPAGAVVYGITEDGETGVQSFSSSGISDDSFKTPTISEGASFVVKPEQANNSNNFVDYIGYATAENGTDTYYRLKGWSTGTEDPIPTGGTATMGNADMTLKAQWEVIPAAEYAVDPEDDGYPVITLATDGNTAAVRQHKSGFTGWSANANSAENALVLNNDLEVYYQATLQMTYPVAVMLDKQKVYNKDFAHFDINVDLDDSLELKANSEGNVTFSFTTTFLRPEQSEDGKTALIKRVLKDEDGKLTYTDLGYYPFTETSAQKLLSGTAYTEYTYTYSVPANDLNGLAGMNFSIPMEWRPTDVGYPMIGLQQEMKLELNVACVMTDASQVVETSGIITGRIDFDKATDINGNNLLKGYRLYAVAQVLLELYKDWRAYCGTDAIAILKAVNCLSSIADNAEMPGNPVYAKAPSYTVTVNYLDSATGSAIADPYVSDKAVIGTAYNVTSQDKKDIDSYIYSYTEGNVTGVLDEDKVINVYYIRGEGALAIAKEVEGIETDKTFEFSVTLKDGDTPLTGTYQYTGYIGTDDQAVSGQIVLDENGTGTVMLGDGYHISINHVPAGVIYEVQETDTPDYLVVSTGHDATSTGNYATGKVEGKIVGGSAGTVTFTNTYQPLNYSVTINYLEYGTDKVLHDPVVIRQAHDSLYDATAASSLIINGYSRKEVTGDELTGTLDSDKTINVYYVKASVPSGTGSGISSILNTEDHYSYIIGYSDGTVRPYGYITRGEVATIFFRLLTDEIREEYWCQTNDYSDCGSDLWCNNAISTLSNLGIIDGFSDGTFRPYAKITRAQFAKMAVGFFETTKKAYAGYFSDVSAGAWYTEYVEAAARVGLIQGYSDGTFRPNTNITRAQACVIINRALGRKPDVDHLLDEDEMITWVDNNPTDWFYADMQEATNSHDYDWLSVKGVEQAMEEWTAKLPQRDWAALEHEWSTAYSAPGGEVTQ